MLPNRKPSKRALPIFLNKPSKLTRAFRKKKLKSKTCPTRSPESGLITLTVFNKMICSRRSSTILSLSSRKKKMKLRSLSKTSSKDTTELIRNNSRSISLIDNMLCSWTLVLKRTRDQWKPRRIIFLSKQKSSKRRLSRSKSNGFKTKLTWSRDKLPTWHYLVTVRSSELKRPYWSKRN